MSAESIRILLVEDNPGDVLLLHLAVQQTGAAEVKLERVPRLGEAIKRAERSSFDVILLDLSLPDSQGLDTVTRAVEQVPDIPIIILTANDDDELGFQAVRRGAQDFLIKGQVDEIQLLRSIRFAIERHRRKRAEEALPKGEAR
ncbi:MAG: response regulator [Thermoplasmata archaeon]